MQISRSLVHPQCECISVEVHNALGVSEHYTGHHVVGFEVSDDTQLILPGVPSDHLVRLLRFGHQEWCGVVLRDGSGVNLDHADRDVEGVFVKKVGRDVVRAVDLCAPGIFKPRVEEGRRMVRVVVRVRIAQQIEDI